MQKPRYGTKYIIFGYGTGFAWPSRVVFWMVHEMVESRDPEFDLTWSFEVGIIHAWTKA